MQSDFPGIQGACIIEEMKINKGGHLWNWIKVLLSKLVWKKSGTKDILGAGQERINNVEVRTMELKQTKPTVDISILELFAQYFHYRQGK